MVNRNRIADPIARRQEARQRRLPGTRRPERLPPLNDVPNFDDSQFARHDQLNNRFKSIEQRIKNTATNRIGLFEGLSLGKLLVATLGLSGPLAAAAIIACGLAGRRVKKLEPQRDGKEREQKSAPSPCSSLQLKRPSPSIVRRHRNAPYRKLTTCRLKKTPLRKPTNGPANKSPANTPRPRVLQAQDSLIKQFINASNQPFRIADVGCLMFDSTHIHIHHPQSTPQSTIHNPQSTIHNPQSTIHIRNPQSAIHNRSRLVPQKRNSTMPLTNTDAILWYNVGNFGEAGYAVPNWSNDVGSLNPQILDWTVPRRPQPVPHHAPRGRRPADSAVDQHGSSGSTSCTLRAANILAGRAVPPGENNMEVHPRPAGRRSVPRLPGAVLPGAQSSSCDAGPS